MMYIYIMSCSMPTYLAKQKIFVPCGRCISCRITKQSQLTFLCEKELETLYQKKQSATFITLTYNDLSLPTTDKGLVTLRKSDLQKFFKRLRILLSRCGHPERIKYIACGEHGSDTHRPHYHAVIFGLSASLLKPLVARAWSTGSNRQGFARLDNGHKWQPIGLVQCSALRPGGIRYITKYMSKSLSRSQIDELYTPFGTEPPFICHSCGIAKEWIIKNAQNISEDRFMFRLNGNLCLYPKYVREFVHYVTGIDPKPFVSKYIIDNLRHKADVSGLSVRDYTIDHARNFELLYINNCRLRGIATPRPDQLPWADIHHRKNINKFGNLLDKICN